ncbi:MAG: glycosyltransferase family 4 protein [Muribaculaceae bacterium]|nr:glycosyltransferase family 4 protein [Muribaculaceae bacterium]
MEQENSTAESKGKIFLISNMWPDEESPGYGSFVKNLTDGFVNNGLEIVNRALIIGRPSLKFEKLKSYFGFFRQIIKGFSHGGFDLIYIHFPNQAIPILKFLYLFKHPKLIVNYHGEDLLYEKKGYLGFLGKMTDKFVSKNAFRIVVPSEYFKKIVDERGIIDAHKIIVSPSGGISEDIFYPSESFIPKTFSKENPMRIGYVGRLEPGKGIFSLLNAISELTSSGFPFKATIIGYGTLEQDVKDFVKMDKYSGNVTYIPRMPQKDLGEVYRNLDLLIFPSIAESLGLTGIESMACGTPVIGSNARGIATYLRDGYNGFQISPEHPSEIVEKIMKYADLTPEQKIKMRENCISTGRKYYSKHVCDELSLTLNSLIND